MLSGCRPRTLLSATNFDVGGAPMTYYQNFNRDLAVSVWAEL